MHTVIYLSRNEVSEKREGADYKESNMITSHSVLYNSLRIPHSVLYNSLRIPHSVLYNSLRIPHSVLYNLITII